MGKFVKIMGVKFDVLEGLQVISDNNSKTFQAAGKIADQKNDGNTIFVCIPCTYELPKNKSFL